MHKLEVIVTSADEARAAAAGGADRLELVRDLDAGGLTPDWSTVQSVLEAVSIPVRVMVRGNGSMSAGSLQEREELKAAAEKFHQLSVDGLVMGWILDGGQLDLETLEAVLESAPNCPITFHRAFEHLADPFDALKTLKRFSQIDRILTCGGEGSWAERKQRLVQWSAAAAPEIGILVGGGLTDDEILDLMADPQFPEVHVGRAARTPPENDGAVDSKKIALMKSPRGE